MNRLIVVCASALFLVACTAEKAEVNTPADNAPGANNAATTIVKMELGKPY